MSIEDFTTGYQAYNSISSERARKQRNALQELADHAGAPLNDITPQQVKGFLAHELERGLNPTTIAWKLNMFRPYFKWAWESGLIEAERYMAIQSVKAPRCTTRHLPRPYSRKELARMRENLDKAWPTVDPMYWKRWRKGTSRWKRVQTEAMRIQIEAIIALALYCGLRSHEIFEASIDDVHYDNAYVVVQHGKGNKSREVPHTTVSREAIRRWIELRTELKPKHDSLWLSLAWDGASAESKTPVYLRPMRWDRFRRLLATIPGGPDKGNWRYHRLRHTAGTEWLRVIKRIELVSRMLGHANIQQTMTYAEIVRDDLHDAMGKAEQEFEERIAS